MIASKKVFRKWRIIRERGSSLLESKRTEIVHVEFTSRCNLKCVFCPVSQPGYKSFDMDPETLNSISNNLKTRFPETVVVNGHGETTIYPRWNQYCNSMLNADLPLHIISNFAKKFSAAEIDTLSMFQSVDISCDSHDPELFRNLRRGADLQTICANVRQLQEARARSGRKTPWLSFSCVVSDRNVLQLPEYVAFGKDLGINQFTFCNLTKHPDVEGAVNARHITEMEPLLLPLVRKSLEDSFCFLKEAHIEFFMQSGLLDSLEEKMRNTAEVKPAPPSPPSGPDASPIGVASRADVPSPENKPKQLRGEWRYSSSRPQNSTRDCLDPWNFILFHANGEVRPCCWQHPVLTLGKRQSVADAFNCSQVKKLRHQLLSGDLSQKCLHCPSRGWTTRAALQKKVKKYLYPWLRWPFFPAAKIPDMPQAMDSKILYSDGWFPEEQDDAAANPERRHFRWISRQAHCTVTNPRRQALLVIRGFVHPVVLNEQKVKVSIGGVLLDEFFPRSEKFVIEYEISPERWGESLIVPVVLEIAKTFVPKQSISGSDDERILGIKIFQLQLL